MNKIKLLDQATVNKIAAGEVVERPASIVKELMENSIDAGATQITIEIKEGGTSLVRISDNGSGIPADEIRTAFLRHSTSKIRKVEDLLSSTSLGFRGEALASIAAVARVEMVTRTEDQMTGIRYVIEGGEEKLYEEIACPVGTTIKVENLFYNTPVRKKFLRRPTAEGATVTELVQKMALAHPEVAIRYFNQKKEPALLTPGSGSLKTAVFAVYGRDIVDKLISVEGTIALAENHEMRVEGFTSRPQLMKATRGYENFFINGRYIKSSVLEKSLDEAYKDFVVPGTFPVSILRLSIDPDILDVNVHPTKMEIRFTEEDRTRFGLYQVVNDALRQQDLISRAGDFYQQRPAQQASSQPASGQQTTGQPAANQPSARTASNTASDEEKSPYVLPAQKQNTFATSHGTEAPFRRPVGAVKTTSAESEWKGKLRSENPLELREAPDTYNGYSFGVPAQGAVTPQGAVHQEAFETSDWQGLKAEAISLEEAQPIAEAENVRPKNLRLVGQIFKTYWIAEEADVFYLVDQHAAHERVYYDQYRRLLREGKMSTQVLMEGIVLTVNPNSVARLDEYQPILKHLGYEVEAFGEDAVIVRGVPFLFGKPLAAEDLTNMLDMLFEGQVDTARDLLIDKIAMMSCKAAVKGNDALSFEEARSLLDQLFASENPYNCPHGRPTIISVTKYELEKRFKRV